MGLRGLLLRGREGKKKYGRRGERRREERRGPRLALAWSLEWLIRS